MVTIIAFRYGNDYTYETKKRVRLGKKLFLQLPCCSKDSVTVVESREANQKDYKPRVLMHKVPLLPILITFGTLAKK